METEGAQIALIFRWILQSDNQQEQTDEIKNITLHLKNMPLNGYLRIFELDFDIVKKCMSDTSWILFLDFKEKRQNDSWICPHCKKFATVMEQRWKCDRCLFFFHTNCTKPQYTNFTASTFENFCFDCFTIEWDFDLMNESGEEFFTLQNTYIIKYYCCTMN